MDVQNLREKYPHLLFFMKENGYSVIYIRRVRAEINHIIQGNKWHKWSTYEDVYLTCTRKSKSEASLRGKRSIIGIIKRFDLEGIFPHPSKRTKFLKPNSYALLPKEYKRVIDSYCVVAKQREKRDDTIYTESHNAAIFLLSLHQKGMDAFNKITERAVLEFFFDNGKLYQVVLIRRIYPLSLKPVSHSFQRIPVQKFCLTCLPFVKGERIYNILLRKK